MSIAPDDTAPGMLLASIGFRVQPHKRAEVLSAVDETLRQVELAAFFEVGGKRLQDPLEYASAYPALIAAMTGLIGRIAVGQIRPLRSRP